MFPRRSTAPGPRWHVISSSTFIQLKISLPMNTKSTRLFSTLSFVLLLLAASFAPKTFADFPPLVGLLATDPCAAEAGSDPAVFTVIRIGPTNAPLTVYYQTGGDA